MSILHHNIIVVFLALFLALIWWVDPSFEFLALDDSTSIITLLSYLEFSSLLHRCTSTYWYGLIAVISCMLTTRNDKHQSPLPSH